MPCFFDMSKIGPIAHGWPKIWVKRTAFVFGVILFFIDSSSILQVAGLTSTKFGTIPAHLITVMTSGTVKLGSIISSPFLKSIAFRVRYKAIRPDGTEIAYFVPIY